MTPCFKVTRLPDGRREIVAVVEPRPPDHPVLGPLAVQGDQVARFLLSACSFEPGATVSAKALHESHAEWAGREGLAAMTATALGRRLTALGFERDKGGPGFTVRRLGLRLRRDSTRGAAEAEDSGRQPPSSSPEDLP